MFSGVRCLRRGVAPQQSAPRIARRCDRRPAPRRRVRTGATLLGLENLAAETRPMRFVRPFGMLDTATETLRVAVDVDEVLGQFLVALNAFCRDRYGMSHAVEDYHVYHFATVWGCSQEISVEIVHAFFKSAYFAQLQLVPGAFEALCEIQEWCDLHVVTSRQHVIRDITMEWLGRHYRGIFTDVHFANHHAKDGPSKKKSELCKEIDAHVLIDDNPVYALDCAAAGMDVILYNWQNAYPWSRMREGSENGRIREVSCWSHVPQVLRRLHHVKYSGKHAPMAQW